MKKFIYCLGLIMILGSVSLFAEEEGGKRIGNVGAYERVFTMSVEACLKTLRFEGSSHDWAVCYVNVLPASGEEGDAGFPSDKAESNYPFKDDVVAVYRSAYPNGYYLRIHSYQDKDGERWPGRSLTKEDIANFLSQYLKERGTEISVKYIKIEK